MPRESQKTRKRRNEAEESQVDSQSSQSSGSQRRQQLEVDNDLDYRATKSTQSQGRSNLSKQELERKVADFVRYMLFMDSKKTAVKRAEITKNVLKEHSRSFVVVFAEAQRKIKKTFGYELVEIEHNKQKAYILVNSMPHEVRQLVESNPDDLPKMGLLLIILALIFMKENVVSEDLLWQTLKKLGVIKGKMHDKFGDAEKLISVEFVRQMYLDRKKIVAGDVATYEYRWGARAKHEITKRQVLEMVAKVYGTDIESWTAKNKEVVEDEQQAGN